MCVFCTNVHDDEAPVITCEPHDDGNDMVYQPAGDSVLFGQLIDEGGEVKAVVSIHEDVTADEIAMLMASFMDRISQMPHVAADPTAIMKALMGQS